MKLRPYQKEAVDSIFNYFQSGNTGNPIVASVTGSGKSLIIADFVQKVFQYPDQKLLMLTHRKELIAQNYEKLLSLWPTAPAGIYSAGLGEKTHYLPITFAGIASVANKAHLFGKVDLVLIDEVHLVSPNEETTYRKFISDLLKVNPYLKLVGLTATPWRIGQGKLTDEGGLFTDICYDNTQMEAFNNLIAEGYLAQLIPKRTHLKIDTNSLHIRGGDFIQSELQTLFDVEQITVSALQETLTVADDRDHGMIFGTGIEHCLNIEKILKAMGQTCGVVHSKQKADLNDHIISEFKKGNIRFLINNDKLTTGFDSPNVDLIVMLRATASIVLWVQCLGRGTRPVYAEGFDLETKEGRLAAMEAGSKRNGCLILDFAGNTQRLGCINDPVLPKKKGKGGGEAPVKECVHCMTLNHISARVCIDCGHEFIFDTKLGENASTHELIKESVTPVIDDIPVKSMAYHFHQTRGKRPSLKITYQAAVQAFNEYLPLEHDVPGVRHKAGQKWAELGGRFPAPASIREALVRTDELKPPYSIRVWLNKQYPEILGKNFNLDTI